MWTLAACNVIAAFASVFVLRVIRAGVELIYMDTTSTLRNEGLITQDRWSRLCDNAGEVLPQPFAIGWLIPAAFIAFGVVCMIAAMASSRESTKHADRAR